MKKVKLKVVFDDNLELPISDVSDIPEWSDQDCNGSIDNIIFRGELWDSAFRPMIDTDVFEDYDVKIIERGSNFVKLSGSLVCTLEIDLTEEKVKNFIEDLNSSTCVIYQATLYMDGNYDYIHIGEQNSEYNPDDIGKPIASYTVI